MNCDVNCSVTENSPLFFPWIIEPIPDTDIADGILMMLHVSPCFHHNIMGIINPYVPCWAMSMVIEGLWWEINVVWKIGQEHGVYIMLPGQQERGGELWKVF